jgi:hypothetical protein
MLYKQQQTVSVRSTRSVHDKPYSHLQTFFRISREQCGVSRGVTDSPVTGEVGRPPAELIFEQ